MTTFLLFYILSVILAYGGIYIYLKRKIKLSFLIKEFFKYSFKYRMGVYMHLTTLLFACPAVAFLFTLISHLW